MKTKQKVTAKERQVVNSDDEEDEEDSEIVANEYEDIKQCKPFYKWNFKKIWHYLSFNSFPNFTQF